MKKTVLLCMVLPTILFGTQVQPKRKRTQEQASLLQEVQQLYNKMNRDPIKNEENIRKLLDNAISGNNKKVQSWAIEELPNFEERLAEARQKKGMSAQQEESKSSAQDISLRPVDTMDLKQVQAELTYLQSLKPSPAQRARIDELLGRGDELELVASGITQEDVKEQLLREERSRLSRELTMAISANNIKRATALLEQGLGTESDVWFAMRASPAMTELVLSYVDRVDPLSLVNENVQSIDLAKKLIARGAQPRINHRALQNPPLLEFLIMQGADVNQYLPRLAQENFSDTPLIAAIKQGNIRAVQLLLQYKANPLIPIGNPRSVRVRQTREGGFAVRTDVPQQTNAYEIAAQSGNKEIIELLRNYAQEQGHTENNPLIRRR